MKNFQRSTAFAFALTAIAALFSALHAPSAHAMGHAGGRVAVADSRTPTAEATNRTENGTQAQIEALQRELEALKERLAIVEGGASAE